MFVIDPVLGTIDYNGQRCRLSKKLMKFFMFLYRHRGKNVSRDAIIKHLYLYEDEEPHDKIIDVFICHMRNRLQPTGIKINTVWGFGYRLDMKEEDRAEIIGSIDLDVEA